MIGRLVRVTGVMVALVWAASALASGEAEGAQKAGAPVAVHEPGPRLPAGRPKAVAQPSSGARRLYVATETGLFASEDEGHHWDRLQTAPLNNDGILAMTVHPQNAEQLFVGGRGGLWTSADGGVRWRPLGTPAGVRSAIRAIAVAPSVPETIYVGTEQEGIFRSPDGGSSWSSAGHGLPEALAGGRVTPIGSLAAHPTNPQIAYAGTELHGLYKTTDGGASWTAINRGLGLFPLPWRAGSPSLVIDRIDPRRMMVMVLRPVHSRLVKTLVYQSADGGDHWFPLEVEPPVDAEGIALVQDPADPTRVVLLTTTGRIRIAWQPVAGVETPGRQP